MELHAMPQRINVGTVTLNVTDRGQGPVLLLVHGFPLDHTMWQAQIEALSATARVIAPDLRGFGQSDVTRGTVSMEQMADDLAQLLKRLGIEQPITFCGLSMGGYVAWQFWRKYASKVRSLVLCDTRAVADTPEGAAGRRTLADRVLREGADVVAREMLPKLFGAAFAKSQPAQVEQVRQTMLSTSSEGIAAALQGLAERRDATSLLPTIQVPTLVVVGSEDVISQPAEMRGLAAALPNATFLEVPGAGHMAPLECPAPVNQAIASLLAGQ